MTAGKTLSCSKRKYHQSIEKASAMNKYLHIIIMYTLNKELIKTVTPLQGKQMG